MPRQVLIAILFLLLPFWMVAQQPDSIQSAVDTTHVKDSTLVSDTAKATDSSGVLNIKSIEVVKEDQLQKILAQNIYLNSAGKPATFIQSPRKYVSKDGIFYSLAVLIFLFALLKFIYARYFSNMFRVFFNTSLRQSQLTDQLLQAKLPSMLFNLFFVLISGWYVYLLFEHYAKTPDHSQWQAIFICAAGLMVIYSGKYAILKFIGWVTGYRHETDTYIFIIFLINKIIAVLLIPIVAIIAFSDTRIANIALLVSFIIIGLMLLMRFFRSYSLLQNRLKVGRFHFLLYIVGVEIIPLLVIYRLALLYMSKKL